MKYLLIPILFICLISFTLADTTFSDNPNYFFAGNTTVSPPTPPAPGNLPTSGGGGGYVINYTNAVPANLANDTSGNNTIPAITIPIVPSKYSALWYILIIVGLIYIIYFVFFKKKEKNHY